MQMNTIELNIDKYESMLKELGVLKTENEEAVRTVVQQRQQEIAFLDSLLNLDSTNGRCVLKHLLTKRKAQLLA